MYDEHNTYGIEVNALKNFTEAPDVVILVGNPYQIMRLNQGIGYHNGLNLILITEQCKLFVLN
ncbi:hypothetical protein AZF37_05170 [endosymbiont 'TC1' of Trimyema compressum]|uniref:DUF169 domain-containing protein n=1 Tax=endosymbiont 'TC1' of Trimyema compressum TaxID=243899 RepID=UPI0007F06E51|nr:DUF169 domain-containing protein [endosymbiont 'TC1' of Trimyema compressum]AMP20649.1 hypothetical protein AZF37_05170 [endosymbiont 'TC1' of Trimyema compressum]